MVQLLSIVSCDRVPVFLTNFFFLFVMHASFPILSELTQKNTRQFSNKTVCVAYIFKELVISV